MPVVDGRFMGMVPWQVSSVHGLPSSWTSVGSGCVVSPPLPSQTIVWQSPVTCIVVAVPWAVNETPHLPATHVRFWQSEFMPGHCVGSVQPPPSDGSRPCRWCLRRGSWLWRRRRCRRR